VPKFYKQNKKKINPRYFLNETTLPMNMLELSKYKDAVCASVESAQTALDLLGPGVTLVALKVAFKSKTGQDLPAELDPFLKKLMTAYTEGLSDDQKKSLKALIGTVCSIPIPKIPGLPFEE